MPVQIAEVSTFEPVCDECDWAPMPFLSRGDAERAAEAHEAFHAGVFPEGEDA